MRTVSLVVSPNRVSLLARFRLIGDEVHATYYDEGFRLLIESWDVTPAHGREFIAEVDRSFRRCSRFLLGDR